MCAQKRLGWWSGYPIIVLGQRRASGGRVGPGGTPVRIAVPDYRPGATSGLRRLGRGVRLQATPPGVGACHTKFALSKGFTFVARRGSSAATVVGWIEAHCRHLDET